MQRKRIRRLAVAGLVSVSTFAGFTGVASAEPGPEEIEAIASDLQVVAGNLPAAGEALADGLQAAAATAQETQSAEQTSQAVGQALAQSGGTLVTGTEQLAALGLGFQVVNLGAQEAARPYLQAIDDPSTAPDLITPEDLSTIAEGIQPWLERAQPSVQQAPVQLLRGNIITEGGVFVAVLPPIIDGSSTFRDTPIEAGFNTAGIAVLVAGTAAEPHLLDAEDQLRPAFDAASPATEQLISIIEGI